MITAVIIILLSISIIALVLSVGSFVLSFHIATEAVRQKRYAGAVPGGLALLGALLAIASLVTGGVAGAVYFISN